MTDNDIIKALECCFLETNCTDCQCHIRKPYTEDCLKVAAKNAIDLMKRQKAEVEELREIVFTDRTEAIKLLKSEAIKEYVERVKDKLHIIPTVYNSHFGRMIDNLVKEMTEDEK